MDNIENLFSISPQSVQLVAATESYGLFEIVASIQRKQLFEMTSVSHQPLLAVRTEDDFPDTKDTLKQDVVVKRGALIVHCASCGSRIGEISFVPGIQIIGCSNCGGRTRVEISVEGQLKTELHTKGNNT